MRTFIAIDLSDEIKEGLTKLQSDLKQSNADVKWVEPENIHLTLKFLGEVTDEYAGKVKEALDKIAAGFKPFEISLSGLGAFPKLDPSLKDGKVYPLGLDPSLTDRKVYPLGLDYPRVIWVGIDKGKGETEEIAKKIEGELSKLGFLKEDREFSAHLTIGRVRSGKNKEVLKEKILAHSSELSAKRSGASPQGIAHSQQSVSCIILYQSTLTPTGPIYTPLHTAIFQKSS